MTEKDIADELNYRVSRQGADSMGFGTIVAAGERGALAHGAPTARQVAAGEMVVIDFGAQWNGYCADLTRTLLFGEVPPERLRIFDLVEQAFEAAMASVRPGVSAAEVDEAHRTVFRDAGMEAYALKGLGHGIGLEIHEHPRVVVAGTHTLRPGMVFTVEPGLYLPGRCGVRTEDDVLVSETGVLNLCTLPHRICIPQ
jgi:Xaa-Pro aminopeptidase/Xaa-Pro dipeptidase